MSLPLQKFREIVFQLLYSHDMGHTHDDDMTELLMKELCVTKKSVKQAQDRVKEILSKQDEIDILISKTSISYDFERIQSVERNVLRLGLFELYHDQNIPPKVAISEAVRMAKKFGSPESATFVNAIMDALYKSQLGEKVDLSTLKSSTQALEESEEIIKLVIEDIKQSE